MKFSIEEFKLLSSTQDLLKDRASAGAAEGLVIQALEQSAGRGRHGRKWFSEDGNLHLSFLLRPQCYVMKLGCVSAVTAVALADVINSSFLKLNWPNDVLFEGRKCAGILLESELKGSQVDWVAVGLGLNVSSAPLDGAKIGGDIKTLRDAFLERFSVLYERPFEDVRKKWLFYSFDQGTPMTVKLGQYLERGVFHDMDAHGNLILNTLDAGMKTITAGDVYVTSH